MAADRYRPSGPWRAAIALIIVLLHASLLWADRLPAHAARVREVGTNSSDQTGPRRVLRVQLVALNAELAGRAETRPRTQPLTDAAAPAPATARRKTDGPRTPADAAASTHTTPDAPAPARAAQPPVAHAPEQASADAAAATAMAESASVQTTPAATVVRTVDAVLCPPMTAQYPARALRLGLQGHVQLRLLLGQDGAIRETTVAVSSGHEILDNAAVAAMQGLRCEPYIENGHAMSALVMQLVEFSFSAAH